jgi:sugar O-acyltransferase (sialic acid O-acetyltransferase NeuD family)
MDMSAVRRLIIICAGGRAGEVSSYLRDIQQTGESIVIEGYVDDHRFDAVFEGAPILGGIEQLRKLVDTNRDREIHYLTAIGDNRARADLVRRIEALGVANLKPWTLRHPTSIIGHAVDIGAGSCIAPSAVITAHARIGEHCIVNVMSSISHDSTLESFVNVNAGVSIGAHVTLGEGSFIGSGATVTNDIQVGEWSVIGAGAVVTDDVPSHVTVAGAPARIVQRHGRGARQSMLMLK